jgi:D-sedoheptulose 7-phosphate isomerase
MTTDEAAAIVSAVLADAIATHERVHRLDPAPVVAAAAAVAASLGAGGRVLVFGNGGSAADAQHAAAELVGRFERDRAALAAVALTADASVLTSVANDYGFEQVFARQIEALGRPGDVAFAITTSGRSPNVVLALRLARERGLRTIALTGRDGGEAGRAAEVHVNVPSASTARVQEVHRTLLHAICAMVEKTMTDA